MLGVLIDNRLKPIQSHWHISANLLELRAPPKMGQARPNSDEFEYSPYLLGHGSVSPFQR